MQMPRSLAPASGKLHILAFEMELGIEPRQNPALVSRESIEVRAMSYEGKLEHSDEGVAVSVPGLPGCRSQGATVAEALQNIADAIAEYLKQNGKW